MLHLKRQIRAKVNRRNGPSSISSTEQAVINADGRVTVQQANRPKNKGRQRGTTDDRKSLCNGLLIIGEMLYTACRRRPKVYFIHCQQYYIMLQTRVMSESQENRFQCVYNSQLRQYYINNIICIPIMFEISSTIIAQSRRGADIISTLSRN